MFRYDIINVLIQRTNAKRYLEIGVSTGECFNKIRCDEKISVDPNVAATHKMTSNIFFEQYQGDPFDIIFIDAEHRREQVLLDILNALCIVNPTGAVVVHDCDPPSEEAGGRESCGGLWCGDVWQAWLDARLHFSSSCWTGVVDADLGCGVILPWKRPRPVPRVPELERTWQRFQSMRTEWLGLVRVEEFMAMLEEVPDGIPSDMQGAFDGSGMAEVPAVQTGDGTEMDLHSTDHK